MWKLLTRHKSEELEKVANAVYYNIDVRYSEAGTTQNSFTLEIITLIKIL